MFTQIDHKVMVTIECPDCNHPFGMDAKFMDSVSELNYKYTCPYCGGMHLLKND